MKKSYVFLAALVMVVMSLFSPSVQAFSGGDGSAANPYQIETADDLVSLGDPNRVNFAAIYGKCFELTADIDLSDYEFSSAVIAPNSVAVGYFNGVEFTGYFQGNGHKISNLKIVSAQCYVGLFGVIGNGGLVTNINLCNVNITGQGNVGAVSGFIYQSSVSHSCATGLVTGESSVGGLVGVCGSGGILDNSYALCSVS
ncbi:MAG: hypothetical protein JXM68_13710, partial [Sedimentisphaerales bacterium]|nr:hypothetical protein [Sedimentisphaerales bacterium]